MVLWRVFMMISFLLGGITNTTTLYAVSSLKLLSLPLAPVNLVASSRSESSVNLSWKDTADDEYKYYVERADHGNDYQLIDSLGENASTYYDSNNLLESHLYFYRIYCKNDIGSSGFAYVSVKTLPSIPLAPKHVVSSAISESEVLVNWTDTAFNETKYYIERSFQDNYQYQLIDSVVANSVSYHDKNLKEEEKYYYRVYSGNRRGHSAYSNETRVRTLMSFPLAPGNLVATLQENQKIQLTWVDNAFNESKYFIEFSQTGNSDFVLIDSVGANKTFYNDHRVVNPEIPYYYRIYAKNKRGESPFSNIFLLAFLNHPEQLEAEPMTSTKIKLTWIDRSAYETGFVIVRKIFYNEQFYTEEIIDTTSPNVTAYIDTTAIRPTTKYAYHIFATNLSGNSEFSNEVTITTPSVTGIKNNQYKCAKLYPNPCKSFIRMLIETNEREENVTISISDVLGNQLRSWPVHISKGETEQQIDMSGLPIGTYMIIIKSTHSVYTSKISKQ
jgi:hypothetical protein